MYKKLIVCLVAVIIVIESAGISAFAGAGFKLSDLKWFNSEYTGTNAIVVTDKTTGEYGMVKNNLDKTLIVPAKYKKISDFIKLGSDYADYYNAVTTVTHQFVQAWVDDYRYDLLRDDGKVMFEAGSKKSVGYIGSNEIIVYDDSTKNKPAITILDYDGNVKSTCPEGRFAAAGILGNGYRPVALDSKLSTWEYVDTNWNVISAWGTFSFAGPFNDGIAEVEDLHNKWMGFINTSGKLIFPSFPLHTAEQIVVNNRVVIADGYNKHGLMDMSGNMVIPYSNYTTITWDTDAKAFRCYCAETGKIEYFDINGSPVNYVYKNPPTQWYIVINESLGVTGFNVYENYLRWLLETYKQYYGKDPDFGGTMEENALKAEKIMRADRIAGGFSSEAEMEAYRKSGGLDGSNNTIFPNIVDFSQFKEGKLYSEFLASAYPGYYNLGSIAAISKEIVNVYGKWKNVKVTNTTTANMSNMLKELSDKNIMKLFADEISLKLFMKNYKPSNTSGNTSPQTQTPVDKPIFILVPGSNSKLNVVTFTDVKPYIDSNKEVQVPAKTIGQCLSATVSIDKSKQSVSFVKGSTKLVFYNGKKQYTLNGKTIKINTPAVFNGTAVYVPVKYLAESLGYKYTWIEASGTIYITKKK